jgi:hypothetical protein
MPKSTQAGRNQTKPSAQQHNQPSGWRITRWHRRLQPIEKFSFWVSVFTLFLVLSAIGQVFAFIQSERALLSISIADFKSPDAPYDDIPIKVSIHNGGKSGALIINGGLNFQIAGPGTKLPETPSYGATREEFRTLVLAGETIYPIAVMVSTMQKPWEADYADKIRAGIYKFTVFGFVEYEDEFSYFGYKKTGFCVRYIYYKPIGDGWISCGARNYVYAK